MPQLFDPRTFSYEQLHSLNNIPGQSLAATNSPETIARVQAITPRSLTPTPQTTIIGSRASDPYPVSSLITPEGTERLTPQETKISGLTQSLEGLYQSLVGKSKYQTSQEKKFGVDSLSTTINDLTAQLTAIKNEAAAIPVQEQQRAAQGTVLTRGLVADENEKLRTNAIQALGVSTLLAASQGQLANAQFLADRAVAQKYDPIIEQIEATTANLKLIRDDPQTSLEDRNRATEQIRFQEQQKRDATEAANAESEIWNIATTAASNGTQFRPSGAYTNLSATLQAISAAQTKEQALDIAVKTNLIQDQPKTSSTPSPKKSGIDFNTAARNLQAQRIPSTTINADGSLSLNYKRSLLDAGLSQQIIDWLWENVTGGASFEEIRQAIRDNGADPKILDVFVTTLQD